MDIPAWYGLNVNPAFLDSNLALYSPFFIAVASAYLAFVHLNKLDMALEFSSVVAEWFDLPNLIQDLLVVHETMECMLNNTMSESTEISTPDIARYGQDPDAQVGSVFVETMLEATSEASGNAPAFEKQEGSLVASEAHDIVRREVGGLVVTLKKKLRFLAIRSREITRARENYRRKEKRANRRRRKQISMRSI